RIERSRAYFPPATGSVVSRDRRNGAKLWQDDANATSAPAVWNERSYFSRREQTAGGKGEVQQNELVTSRANNADGERKDMSTTRQKADYLDYSKRKASVSEQRSQAF